eukprot:2368803-Rhodomonas_salina.1
MAEADAGGNEAQGFEGAYGRAMSLVNAALAENGQSCGLASRLKAELEAINSSVVRGSGGQ